MLEKEQEEAEAKAAVGGYLGGDQSMDKEDEGEETDSIVIDSSELDSLNAEQMDEVMENAAAEYTKKYFSESKEKKIDLDKYHFSVA